MRCVDDALLLRDSSRGHCRQASADWTVFGVERARLVANFGSSLSGSVVCLKVENAADKMDMDMAHTYTHDEQEKHEAERDERDGRDGHDGNKVTEKASISSPMCSPEACVGTRKCTCAR